MSNTAEQLSVNETTVTGVITSILSHKYDGAIFKIDSVEDDRVKGITVIADKNVLPTKPTKGEVWQVCGNIQKSLEYGEQIYAIDCYRKRPSGSILIQFIGDNNKFAGIGNKKAIRLWATFGENLYEILDKGDIELLTDKKQGKLSFPLAENLIDVWQSYSSETPIIEWLHSKNFPARLAIKVRKFWGADAISKITDDPYRMLAFENWKKVDALSQSLGIAPNDTRRQLAAVEAATYEYYDKGNTAIQESKLNKEFNKKTSLNVDIVNSLGESLRDRVVRINDSTLFQSIGAYALERTIKKRILSFIDGTAIQKSLFAPKYNEAKLHNFEQRNGFPLNNEQIAAIKLVLTSQVCSITGGAGVGKTTVLQAIFDQIGDNNVIYQVALTGRAAKRMMEVTGYEARTIASFILRVKETEIQENSFLFIDEASMVDTPTLYRLLKILPNSTTICFVGDPYQLPPIGPGLPFKKLVDKLSKVPHVELTETHRFAKKTGILEVANGVRNQSKNIPLDEYQSLKTKDYGVSFINANETTSLIESTLRTYREFLHYGEVQIISPTNNLCEIINLKLHNEHRSARAFQGLPIPSPNIKGCAMTIGDPLLHHSRNDYSKELYNGSLGILTKVYDNPIINIDDDGNEHEYIAEANFDEGNIVQLTEYDFKFISLGYGITIHRSQGSQFERIIFLCPESRRRSFLDNTMIYTAITRAKKQICIIGSRNTFNLESSSEPRAFSRCVGLEFGDTSNV